MLLLLLLAAEPRPCAPHLLRATASALRHCICSSLPESLCGSRRIAEKATAAAAAAVIATSAWRHASSLLLLLLLLLQLLQLLLRRLARPGYGQLSVQPAAQLLLCRCHLNLNGRSSCLCRTAQLQRAAITASR